MSDHETSKQQFPPSDVERLEVIARLIEGRIADLSTARSSERFTPEQERELYVLERLRDDWLLEGRK